MPQVQIDPARLLGDLHALRSIGAYRTGAHRPTYSPQDMESRHWLVSRLTEAGLAAEIDGIGNVLGHAAGPGPHLLIGSHIETQNHAGWLDGALGVIYGLEVARALGRNIDVAAWADEEGHFDNFVGSRSFVGRFTDADIDKARNRYDGTPLRDALQAAGLAGRSRTQVDPSRYRGYLEAHIEQGDELDSSGKKIGVVTSIVAIWQYRIVFQGVQNHAGTTRMAIRKDAGLAAVRLAAAIDQRFPEVAGPRSVWTVGRITLEPGAPSIVPGRAEMLFQFRDADPQRLLAMQDALKQLVEQANAGPCSCGIADHVAIHAAGDGLRIPGCAGRRGGGALPRRLGAHAQRRRPRCTGAGGENAGRHAVRAEHRRHQPSLVGGYEGGGHRAGLPGPGRCRGRDSRRIIAADTAFG